MALEYVLTSYLDTYFRCTSNMTQKRNQWHISVGGEALPSSQTTSSYPQAFSIGYSGNMKVA